MRPVYSVSTGVSRKGFIEKVTSNGDFKEECAFSRQARCRMEFVAEGITVEKVRRALRKLLPGRDGMEIGQLAQLLNCCCSAASVVSDSV